MTKIDEHVVTKHPAFGRVSVYRTQAQPGGVLFGSDVLHSNYITVKLEEVDHKRSLGQNWTTNPKTLVEFSMSEYAWGRFVSSFNDTSGTEITYRFIKGREHIPPLMREESDVDIHRREQREVLKDVLDTLEACKNVVTNSKKNKSYTGKVINEIEKLLQDLGLALTATLPMLENDFVELTERKIAKAKTEFEAHARNHIHGVGLEALFQDGRGNAHFEAFGSPKESEET